MRITELLKKQSIELGVKAASKEEAIDCLIALMDAGGRLNDRAGYKEGILARESLGSTAIGEGIAIPHAKVEAVKEPGLAAITVPEGVDYEAFDGSLSNLIFMIAAPAGGEDVHLEALSRLSTLLMNPGFKEALIHAGSKEEFLEVIDQAETERFGKKEEMDEPEKAAEPEKTGFRVLAVTACPTGIAHTYMAAENLENTGKKLGISLKAETDGSGGAQNILTKEEIREAEAIIVAADKNVEMARFDGKPVIMVPVADGIHKAEELIRRAVSGTVPVYHHEGGTSEAEAEGDKSIGRTIYKHLMNGVSHMLPFVIGGGILIALAFLFDMDNAGAANFGSGTPLAAFLKNVGGLSFSMMMPILAGYIAMSIGERPALMPGIVGGFLATTGGSGFFGALFAGFIAGYLIIFLKKALSHLPKALDGTKSILFYPVLGLVLIGVIMTYIINPPTSIFNTWLFDVLNSMTTSSRIVLGFILGGMMSIDFGGPINKAAYVFGTASLMSASGQAVSSGIMASVMVGGMVPPLAIALAMLLFKGKFTPKERQSTITNFIMGLSFITEGAIPFAASDPVHVIPPCAIGAAVAGALSMLFNCTLPAPHGGIFVFGVITNWPMYIAALVAGVIVAAILLGIFRKKRPQD